MATAQGKTRVMVTLTDGQLSQLDRITAETGVSRSGVVSLALSQWLAGWQLPEQQRACTTNHEDCAEPMNNR